METLTPYIPAQMGRRWLQAANAASPFGRGFTAHFGKSANPDILVGNSTRNSAMPTSETPKSHPATRLFRAILDWAPALLLIGFLVQMFFLFEDLLAWLGFEGLVWWQSLLIWWAAGLVCAFGWPLRYWDGMHGRWLRAIPGILFTSMSGPFALILGFPL